MNMKLVRVGAVGCLWGTFFVTACGSDSAPEQAATEAKTGDAPDAGRATPPTATTTTPSSSGNVGPAGDATCHADTDCVSTLPATTPPGCAEAKCEQSKCIFRAKDADGDGDRALNCKAQSITIETGTDCDDTDAEVNTRHAEVCDGKDNDCNGRVDDGVAPSTLPCTTERHGVCEGKGVYVCEDGKFSKCNAVEKATPTNKSECDGQDWNCDGHADTAGCACHPGDAVVCNQTCGPAITHQCQADGTLPACDPGPQRADYCSDADNDGYPGQCGTYCPAEVPGGWKPKGAFGPNAGKTDCDEGNGARHPDAAEQCNGVDDNCNGGGDEPQANCGVCPSVTCGGACATQCRAGWHLDGASGQCVSDSDNDNQAENVWDLSIGGAFSCGLSYDKNYGGYCSNGRVRSAFNVGKTAGGNGHCEAIWASDDPHDCTVRVHFGTAWCDNITCHIDIQAKNPLNICQ